MRSNRTAVFISGVGHSGSTLLGLLLGSHPDVFYAGEAAKVRFLGDLDKPPHKRTCKLCGPGCPVWSTFVPAPEPDLYEQLSIHTGRPVVVDSAKGLDWLPASLRDVRAHGGRAVLLFLRRDPRAVLNSRLRKYPDRDPADELARYRAGIEGTRGVYDAFDGDKLELRYEDLATRAEATLRRVCATVGVAFHPEQLRFAEHEHHLLGGNNGTQYQVARAHDPGAEPPERSRGYYAGHPDGIALDERWRTELDPVVRALVERTLELP